MNMLVQFEKNVNSLITHLVVLLASLFGDRLDP